jgi:hypothetical protein
MPDPVTCHPANDDPSIIHCDDVNVSTEPGPPPLNECRSPEPGVRALVGRHEQPLVVRRVETIRVPTQFNPGEIALDCAGKAVGAILGVIGASRLSPWLAIPTAAKVGWDLGECAANSVNEATQRALEQRALEMCAEEGGTTVGVVNGTLTCEAPPLEQE